MLRGVNRQIIEINSTDNSYFERAILFVRPEFSELSEARLQDNATSFLKNISTEKQFLKKAERKKTAKKPMGRQRIILSFVFTALAVAVAVTVILKII